MSVKTCRHIKVDGTSCQAPALRERNYCRFHLQALGRRMRMARARARREPYHLVLPILEDMNSVQVARMQVLDALAAGLLSEKSAGLFLYGLQGASSDLRRPNAPRLGVYDEQIDAAPRAEEYANFEEEFDLPCDLDLAKPPEVVFPAAAATSAVASSPPLDPEVAQRQEREEKYRKVTAIDVELEHLRKEQDQEAHWRRLRELQRADDLRRQREQRKLTQARYLVEADQRNQDTEQRMAADFRAWEEQQFGPRADEAAATGSEVAKKPSATVPSDAVGKKSPESAAAEQEVNSESKQTGS
jgi:hypothetical protein